ncbi:unnamed protein product [Taenia asiatica]|uniref:Transmembrane protein n=1 Tax=Taenia asiatica TaxID=60517 RepID=A0A0R3WFJ9_TAEAS|nr:unnamed protein product [Taenia asiatica]
MHACKHTCIQHCLGCGDDNSSASHVQPDSDQTADIWNGEAIDAINCFGHFPTLSAISMAARLMPLTAPFLLAYLLFVLYGHVFGFSWRHFLFASAVVDFVAIVLRPGGQRRRAVCHKAVQPDGHVEEEEEEEEEETQEKVEKEKEKKEEKKSRGTSVVNVSQACLSGFCAASSEVEEVSRPHSTDSTVTNYSRWFSGRIASDVGSVPTEHRTMVGGDGRRHLQPAS